jgi:hypothetical protein
VAQADLASLLPRLHRIWCAAGEIRETVRQPLQEQSTVAVGFREIHKLANPKPLVLPKEFEVYKAGMTALRGGDEQTLAVDQQANPTENWQILDHSASGMRAQRTQPGARLRRGMLLGFRFDSMQEDSGFALAEVRWLQQFTDGDGGGIVAGVRFVSMYAQAALVRVFNLIPGRYQDIGPAFVLSESRSPQLILPSGWFAPARNVDLWHQDTLSKVELTDLQTRGADYEIVGYEPIN